ncbi:CPXCG motif-containing cysteine-rich protein [Shewanella gelidii]|uniref:CPXCG motif-containing cysteine-rich protein n=1 Tax=Shewanella gelidii TaxID=1642821 RepID=A0A917NBD1_9GAMM|nr:CPXCG motif-containing cysteine-rich protein [Shewanella gelidii]MCL1098009.1 CPXCG motif-containing cysteine-rich protein [Shewanella gelidii]GGI85408.1 CPXCG motif-containing cysteine-rich protein [Shewanella gelidii]
MKYQTRTIACPHCGHHQQVDIDATLGNQEYFDDCRICCNPIHMRLHIDEMNKKIELFIDSDDEQLY